MLPSLKPSLEYAVKTTWSDIQKLPQSQGCYAFFNSEKVCLYVGRSLNICSRVSYHVSYGRFGGGQITTKGGAICYWITNRESMLEIALINYLKPINNIASVRSSGCPQWDGQFKASRLWKKLQKRTS